MSAQNKATYDASLEVFYPDNTTELISPEDQREESQNLSDSVLFKIDGEFTRIGATAGTPNAYTIALTNNYPTSYNANVPVLVKVHQVNTGAATININSLGAKAWRKYDGTAYASGEIVSGRWYTVIYDSGGDYFITLAESGSVGSSVVRDNAATLTLSSPGKFVHYGTGSTWTLTTGTAALVGKEFDVFNDGSDVIVMAYSGGNTAVSTFGGNVDPGSWAVFYWDGTKWIVKQ